MLLSKSVEMCSPTASPPESPPRRLSALTASPTASHILDYSQLSSLRPESPNCYTAMWHHTPVLVTVCPSLATAAAVRAMAGLRHPNVQFLLGVTRTPVAAVTEHIAEVRDLSSVLAGGALPVAEALHIALDLARGLLYLHFKTGEAHGSVGADAVFLDVVRQRAVLRMLGRRVPPSCGFDADVRGLVRLLADLLGGDTRGLRFVQSVRRAQGADEASSQVVELVEEFARSPPSDIVVPELSLICKQLESLEKLAASSLR